MHVLLYAKLPYIHPQCSAQRAIADDKEMYLRQMPQNGSGGLEEVFTLPVIVIVPGTCLGALGGLLGGAARKVAPHTP